MNYIKLPTELVCKRVSRALYMLSNPASRSDDGKSQYAVHWLDHPTEGWVLCIPPQYRTILHPIVVEKLTSGQRDAAIEAFLDFLNVDGRFTLQQLATFLRQVVDASQLVTFFGAEKVRNLQATTDVSWRFPAAE